MSGFWIEYGLFIAKIFTVVVAIVIVMLVATSGGRRKQEESQLEVKNLNARFDSLQKTIASEVLNKADMKKAAKEEKSRAKEDKAAQKKSGKGNGARKQRVYVIDFHGDIKASGTETLRDEVTAIVTMAEEQDEVLLRMNNSGGIVHEHGLAASQLLRLKDAGLSLTVSVDKVAASGGYMMAVVADKIVAAPFAVIGSIGVLAQLPNFARMLDRHGVDFEQHTAGEYKRTVTMFGENTEEQRDKLKEQLEDTHELFKAFVAEHRPELDLATVATGEHWYGTQAMNLGLVDEIRTSDDYLLTKSRSSNLFEVDMVEKKNFPQKLVSGLHTAIDSVLENISDRSNAGGLWR
jgi:serine protease SohB